jgi:hypothetical protein
MATKKNSESVEQAPVEETKLVLCETCTKGKDGNGKTPRYHEKTFDGPGIGHWPFDIGTDAERQFSHYCSEESVALFIPLAEGEKEGSLATPQVNGLKVGIYKGTYVNVPKSLAEIVMDSLNQTSRIQNGVKTAPNPYTGEVKPARLDQRSDAAALE